MLLQMKGQESMDFEKLFQVNYSFKPNPNHTAPKQQTQRNQNQIGAIQRLTLEGQLQVLEDSCFFPVPMLVAC